MRSAYRQPGKWPFRPGKSASSLIPPPHGGRLQSVGPRYEHDGHVVGVLVYGLRITVIRVNASHAAPSEICSADQWSWD